jgi:hypothetical protein
MATINTSITSNYNNGHFTCETCNFKCSKKGDYSRHIITPKHKNQQSSTQNTTKTFTCECGRNYKERTGLWKHKKICSAKVEINTAINITDKDSIIINLLQQNAELQKSLIELSKEKTITHNNNTTNSHNKTFNLQFFLNETCKDALNINDFVSSIQLQLTDLETTGRVGYVEGISKIIVHNLNNMEQYRRPMHCSDVKREIIYIKDNNEWTKEDTEKPLLIRAIKIIANENIKKINEWKRVNPDCTDSDSKKNNIYLNIVSNAMSGCTQDETNKNIGKIISNIVKETQIEK